MLVLSRQRDERICLSVRQGTVIPDEGLRIDLCVVEIRGDKVRLGLSAPMDQVAIHRQEVQDAIDRGAEPKVLHQPPTTSH
jgi:carbon storage regulator CsrA